MRFFVFFILFGLLATSCKTRKKTIQAKPRNIDTAVFVNQGTGKDSLLRQKWEYFSGRIGLDYYGPDQELSGVISLRMRKDSLIWFSASAAIGIQVMKGIISRDSIKILDIFNKKYRAYSIKELGKQFGADIGLRELQNIIISNPVYDTMVYAKDTKNNAWLAVKAP